jgi:hypothetical protein
LNKPCGKRGFPGKSIFFFVLSGCCSETEVFEQLYATLKYGIRLNMAAIGLNVINNRGLPPQIPAIEQMGKGGAAWNRRRNGEAGKTNRRLRPLPPGSNLQPLYP